MEKISCEKTAYRIRFRDGGEKDNPSDQYINQTRLKMNDCKLIPDVVIRFCLWADKGTHYNETDRVPDKIAVTMLCILCSPFVLICLLHPSLFFIAMVFLAIPYLAVCVYKVRYKNVIPAKKQPAETAKTEIMP